MDQCLYLDRNDVGTDVKSHGLRVSHYFLFLELDINDDQGDGGL